MYRFHVVHAIFWRNLKQYFTSILGYLFIFVFVSVVAVLTFNQQFFADNLVTLDQLTQYFPALLLFFIPAFTMTVWADEKRQGTDAILFTLPASDFEILMGKFKSVIAVYTIALLFSATTVYALWRLGEPDWGVIATTYLGYWLSGVALASIGMFASSLTSSTTVAFVLGSILCAIPVMLGYVLEGNQLVEFYSVAGQLREFTLGLITLPGVVYFVSITAFMLYLNYVVISHRHWSRGRQVSLFGHFASRVVALAVALFAINLLAFTSSAAFNNRVDLTSESLFTLDRTTRDVIDNAATNNRQISIEAFLSPEMPRKYVNTRKNLVGLLRQYDRLGGTNVEVRFVNVAPNTKQVEEALSWGLEKRRDVDTVGGQVVQQDVFMGAVITSTFDRVILPFIESDTSIEYQMTRAIANATMEKKRLDIGILKTDAHFDNFVWQGREYLEISTAPTLLDELKQLYDVRTISVDDLPALKPKPALSTESGDPKEAGDQKESNSKNGDSKEAEGALANESDSAAPNTRDDESGFAPDVLIVADPSSIPMVGQFNLVNYIKQGNPVLILADPLPFYPTVFNGPTNVGVINAPSHPQIRTEPGFIPSDDPTEPPQQVRPGGASALRAFSEERATNGSAEFVMQALEIEWDHGSTVWSIFNPHPGFKPAKPKYQFEAIGDLWPPEYGPRENLFVFAKSWGGHVCFNSESAITRGLHEMLFMYPGSFRKRKNPPEIESSLEFVPLITLKPGSAGHLEWDELTEDKVIRQIEIDPITGESNTYTGRVVLPATGQYLRTIRKRPELQRDFEFEASETPDANDTGQSTPDNEDGKADSTDNESEGESEREFRRALDAYEHVLAAHIRSKSAASDAAQSSTDEADEPSSEKGAGEEESSRINVVIVADIDFVSEAFYQQRDRVDSALDNIAFFVNAIETLSGDETFVRLRNRRPIPRTLTTIENLKEPFRILAVAERDKASAEIEERLAEVQKRAEEKEKQLQNNESLSSREKRDQVLFAEINEGVKLSKQEAKAVEELEKRISSIEAEEKSNTAWVETKFRWLTILSAGIPALFLGSLVLLYRTVREQSQIDPQRKVSSRK